MDGNIQKALWLGVGIMIFLAVVAIGMTALSKGQELSRESMNALDDNAMVLANAAYSMYDNQNVSGTDALNAVKKFRSAGEPMAIVIDTSASGAVTYNTTSVTDTQIQALQTKGNAAYVNPYGEFYATLQTDANGVVSGITFVQQ